MHAIRNLALLASLLAAAHNSASQTFWRELPPREAAETLPLPHAPREFRGVWVATVQNIDWPSAKNLTHEQQRAEIIRNLDVLQSINCNAALLQIRPSCDALYQSNLEPWSEYLTGASGKAPSVAWDPLEVWLEETHKRAIDIHIWVNPFRARHFKAESPNAGTHIASQRPDLVREYDSYQWLDPGEPEAVEHVLKVIRDIVTRYDIDGVVIDDYFYPYPKDNVSFPDDASYNKYVQRLKAEAPEGTAIRPPKRASWREQNINSFVARWYSEIKAIKPEVLVGIAPFGIWRPGNPPGIKGMDAVEKLHADARQWLREGQMDYVSPQLYWKLDAPEQPYVPLLEWWLNENLERRQVWPSNYASRVMDASKTQWGADEIVRQIETTRHYADRLAGGNILYSLKPILEDRDGLRTQLAKVYSSPALIPLIESVQKAFSQTSMVEPPRILTFVASEGKRLHISWCIDETPPTVFHSSELSFPPFPAGVARIAIWIKVGGQWHFRVAPGALFGSGFHLDAENAEAIVLAAVDRIGRIGAWTSYTPMSVSP